VRARPEQTGNFRGDWKETGQLQHVSCDGSFGRTPNAHNHPALLEPIQGSDQPRKEPDKGLWPDLLPVQVLHQGRSQQGWDKEEGLKSQMIFLHLVKII